MRRALRETVAQEPRGGGAKIGATAALIPVSAARFCVDTPSRFGQDDDPATNIMPQTLGWPALHWASSAAGDSELLELCRRHVPLRNPHAPGSYGIVRHVEAVFYLLAGKHNVALDFVPGAPQPVRYQSSCRVSKP